MNHRTQDQISEIQVYWEDGDWYESVSYDDGHTIYRDASWVPKNNTELQDAVVETAYRMGLEIESDSVAREGLMAIWTPPRGEE